MRKLYLIFVIACLFILSLTYFSIWWVVLDVLIALVCLVYRTHRNLLNSSDARNTELQMQLAAKNDQLDKVMRNEINMRNKMEEIQKTKTTVLNKISHEIRSPMNGMMGMASLLGQTLLNGEQKEYLETIRSCGKNMITTINDILLKDTLNYALEKNDKTRLEKINFNIRDCIEDAVEFFAAKDMKAGIDLMCRIGHDIPQEVAGDEARLRQVLSNLIENAIEHTTSGEIIVTVTLQEEINKGELNLAFEVKDTGSGIPAAQLNAILSRLSVTDSSDLTGENNGIGLIIAGRLVKIMGGNLHLTSKSTRGTTAQFNIIAGYDAPFQKRSGSDTFTGLAGKKALILVNNASLGDILRDQMEYWKMNTRLTESRMRTLELLASGDHVDLLLMDNKISGIGDIELAQKIRQQYPGLPIILMSHPGNIQYKSHPRLFTSVLSTPVRQNILFSQLSAALIPEEKAVVKEEINIALLLSDKFSEKYPMHILVAEDNPINQQFAVKILNRLGYKPGVANNGEEVLEIVSHENFDLILMDVEMPVMDGLEATRMIRLCLDSQPVIIAMTANAMQGDREICLKSGMDDYLSKPVALEELIGILEKWALQAKVKV